MEWSCGERHDPATDKLINIEEKWFMHLVGELDYLSFYGREIITPLAITGAFRLPRQQYSSGAIELRVYEVNTKYLLGNEIYEKKYI